METYTDSAKTDAVMRVLNSDKYARIVYSIRGNPKITFSFNPLDDDTVTDIYLQEPEEFPLIVKNAITILIGSDDDELRKNIMTNLRIAISDVQQIKFNEWDARYEGMPISTRCQIVGTMQQKTYTKFAEYICTKCHKRMCQSDEPTVCENQDCTSRKFHIDQRTHQTGNLRTVIIQEPVEEIRHGMPNPKTCIVRDEMVHEVFSGQRKLLTGIFRSIPEKDGTNKITINAISMQNLDSDVLEFPSEPELEQYVSLSKQENWLTYLTDSFAPHIKFRHDEKLAVILARVGAKNKNIHTFLSGPYGTAKSQILKFLPKVTPRCGMAVGGQGSGVGITASMVTLPDKTRFVQAGVVSQSDGSCCVLDELSLFDPDDLGMLYPAMTSGIIQYRKGGIIQDLKANTAIIAGANPKNGYYEPILGMRRNLNIPGALMSRFDIIFNVLPESSEIESQQISDHIKYVEKIGIPQYVEENNLLDIPALTTLFNHMKSLQPILSDEAGSHIDKFYNTMMYLQKSGDQVDGAKPIDRRFYDTILSISSAFAKIHLSEAVTEEHARMGIDFIKKSLESFGMKTDKEMHTIPFEQQDKKDKHIAFDTCWMELCKLKKTQHLFEQEIIEYLIAQRPDIFDQKRASKIFDEKNNMGALIKEDGRYRLV